MFVGQVNSCKLALKNLLLRLPSSYSVIELEKRNRIEQQFRFIHVILFALVFIPHIRNAQNKGQKGQTWPTSCQPYFSNFCHYCVNDLRSPTVNKTCRVNENLAHCEINDPLTKKTWQKVRPYLKYQGVLFWPTNGPWYIKVLSIYYAVYM